MFIIGGPHFSRFLIILMYKTLPVNSFDFCQAGDQSETVVENLGQVVFGERIHSSPYKVSIILYKHFIPVYTYLYTVYIDTGIL